MKKLLNFSLLILTLFTFAGCRSESFDPVKGITIQMDVKAEIVNSNASKKDVAFEKSYAIDLRDIFVSKYNIDPSKLETFYVNEMYVTFNQERCKQLKTYEVSATLPAAGTFNQKDQCDLPSYLGQGAIISLNPANTSVFSKTVLTTNFATDIKTAKPFIITFKMTPNQDFDSGFGAGIILSTRATYKP